MAGYIFAIAKDYWTNFCKNELEKGFFTPLSIEIAKEDMLSTRKRKARNKILAATFGDMVTMKPGDNVYFLSNRKIYGIGKTVQIGKPDQFEPDCKYDNYKDASALIPDCEITPTDYLTTKNTRARWVCFFKPSPYFFCKGVDMDDVLRFRPHAFKSLRAYEKLSFIKIDDEENRALKEYISLMNEPTDDFKEPLLYPYDDTVHNELQERNLKPFVMDISKCLANKENKDYVISEMLIESLLLQKMSRGETDALGDWDYLSHQLIASPFKPLKYIDKIDVFGYRFSTQYGDLPKLVTKYLLVELKKDEINHAALECI